MPPKLSILMACYDCATTLDVALRSLARQSVRDFEVIAVDDGSTDGTADVLDEWALQHRWLRVLTNHANQGIGTTRNRSLVAARGTYIAFVDADDWVSPDHLARLVAAADDTGVDFVRTDYTRAFGTARVIVRAPEIRRNARLSPRTGFAPLHDVAMVDYPNVWAGLYRRSMLHDLGVGFVDGIRSAEDRPFTWSLHGQASSYMCLSEHGYYYRREASTSLTAAGDRRQLDFLVAIDAIVEYTANHLRERPFMLKAYRHACQLIAHHVEKRERLASDVVAEMRQRCHRFLAGLDPDDLARSTDELPAARTTLLRGLREDPDFALDASPAN